MALGDFELSVLYPTGATNVTSPTSWSDAVIEIGLLPLNQPWDAVLRVFATQPVLLDVPLLLVGTAPVLGSIAATTLRIVGAVPGTNRATLMTPVALAGPLFEAERVGLELTNLDFVGPGTPGVDLIVGRGSRTTIRSCTFQVVGPPLFSAGLPLGLVSVTDWVEPALLAVEGSLVEGLGTGVRARGRVEVSVTDSVFLGCHSALILHEQTELIMRNSVIEGAQLGLDYTQDGAAPIRSRGLDCRFTDCRLGVRAEITGETGTLEIARSEFSAPTGWTQGRAGPIPPHP